MRELGSEFVAIYGAEPLTRMHHLPEVVNKIYSVGMKTTVITAMPRSQKLVELLQDSNLDSVTCSYDGLYLDNHRKSKSVSGQKFLADHLNLRDRACVATVSKENADQVPQMARRVTDDGIWFLFDLYHGGTGPLSKCGNDDGLNHSPTSDQVQYVCQALIEMKDSGRKIHASKEYLSFLMNSYNGKVRDTWHCRGSRVGWLTVDADGSILPCDDWQKVFPGGKIWDDFSESELEDWALGAVEDCPGCSWNTHWDAVAIESGLIQLGSYVH